ncbi:MAG TPA: amidohydrolase family protein [Gemmatimonadales bacterium]|nr:amidohydrolase family protein [Gemmatimonadales bacterium]
MRARTILLASLVGAALEAPPVAAQLAIRGETVHTMAGPPLRDGVVLIDASGRIERVGPAGEVRVPRGYRTLRARVVTPGLVDAHSVVGLAGYLNQPHDQDQLETSDPIQPELRAVDAYNAGERLIEWVRGFGVTTLHTGHGPGALVSGQTMVVKTHGATLGEALVDSATMVAMTLGPEVSQTFSGKSPGTRAKGVAMLRAELVKAQEYREKLRAGASDSTKRPARDLGLEVLVRVLDGELPALVTAHRATEILAALRLQKEFGFRLVLDGAAESYLVADEIRAAGVPVILHPTMVRHGGTTENATLETARRLKDAGITVALQSGYEGYVPKTRVVLFEAAMAAANGLSFQEALATITIDAARVIGQDRRIGSLEAGKDGDVALFDGDPFEHTTHVCGVVIRGRVVSETCR